MMLGQYRTQGNLNGPNPNEENKPEYIDEALFYCDVEVDLWKEGEDLYLGHDYPQYKIDFSFLKDRIHKLWIHAKNPGALEFLNNCSTRGEQLPFNYFFHTDEDYVLTSKNYIWVYPGKKLLKNSICVMPEREIGEGDIRECSGVCTDFVYGYILEYKEE